MCGSRPKRRDHMPSVRMAVDRTPGRIFVGRQQPAECRTSTEHGKKIRRDANDADSFRVTLPGQVVVAANRDGDLLKSMVPCS